MHCTHNATKLVLPAGLKWTERLTAKDNIRQQAIDH